MQLDDIPVIGPIGPAPDGLDEPHWRGLEEGRLLLQRCAPCRRWIWAPQWLCPACYAPNPAWVEVEARSTVYSWTRTWHPFGAEFADHLPYVTVLAELPHAGGIRLLGVLAGGEEVAIGDSLKGVIQAPSSRTSGAAVLRWTRA